QGGLDDEGLFTLFTLYLNTDNGAGAMKVAQRMIQNETEDARGYLALGAAFERDDQLGEAEKAYRRGLKIEPDQPALYDALARLKRQEEDSQGELAVLQAELHTARSPASSPSTTSPAATTTRSRVSSRSRAATAATATTAATRPR